MTKKPSQPKRSARKTKQGGPPKDGRAESENIVRNLRKAVDTITQRSAGTRGSRVQEATIVPYGSAAQWIAASDFKAQCLELMDRVRTSHESIVVTKYGEPVAKLVPFEEEPPDIVGFMRGSVLAYSDLISPIDEPWDANQ